MLIRRFLLPFLMLAATAFPLHAQDDPVISDDLSELRVSLKEEYLQCDQEKQFFYEEYDIVHEQIVQLLEKNEGLPMLLYNQSPADKNFLNLTRNNPYEYLKLSFTVKYDTDVERARTLLKEACQALLTKDKEGRDIVEPGYGLHVVVDKFDEGGITFALKQDVLVSERYGYISRAKELIFKTLAANNIEIPFQQIAVHLVQDQG